MCLGINAPEIPLSRFLQSFPDDPVGFKMFLQSFKRANEEGIDNVAFLKYPYSNQEALEAFAAKKKLEEQRYELKTFIQFSHGHKAWDELIAMEGKIRKVRQEQLYKRQEFKDRCIEGLFIFFLVCTIVGFGWLVWYLKSIQE